MIRFKRTNAANWQLVFAALTLVLAGIASGQDQQERTAFGFEQVQAEAIRLAELSGGSQNVLLVFDIDNTLLAMNQDLGSDQWYDWQKSLPDDDPWNVKNLLGEELLDVQGFLYSVGSMRATDPLNQSRIVRELQQAGFSTLLLTSRGPEFRDATWRELLANGYDFRESTIAPRGGYPDSYLPYEQDEPAESGITKTEAEQWLGDTKPRRVSYREGIYMTAGQHKGAMLRMLLHRTGNEDKFSHLIFVDDNARHTASVRAAFSPINNATAVTFHYTREDSNVFRFKENRCCEKYCATMAVFQLRRCVNRTNVSKLNPPVHNLSIVGAR